MARQIIHAEFKPEVCFQLARKVIPVFVGWDAEGSVYRHKMVGFVSPPRDSINIRSGMSYKTLLDVFNSQIDDARESLNEM